MEFSVFHTVFGVNFCEILRFGYPNPGKRSTQVHQHLTPNLTTPLAEKNGERSDFALLFGPDIFRWGGGLSREGVGAKKFGMSLETQENKLFGGMSWDFAGISRGGARKV